VAVFQVFKEVEVAVRNAANAKGAGYPDDLVGVTLMRRAFHRGNGPLTDTTLVTAEREAEAALFAGGIGRHAKNPPGIVQHAISLYLRFTLSYRDAEELLAERGPEVSYETVRRWVLKFGPGSIFCPARPRLGGGSCFGHGRNVAGRGALD
jgi:hypothetical protein